MVLQPESLRSLRKASDDGTGSGSGIDSPHAHGATDRELHHASLKVASWSSQNGKLCRPNLTHTHDWLAVLSGCGLGVKYWVLRHSAEGNALHCKKVVCEKVLDWKTWQGCTRQTALERQDMSCTYLAHHKLENVHVD